MPINSIYCVLNADKSITVQKGGKVCQGENKTTDLKIAVPADLINFAYFLEFECPKDKKYQTAALEFSDDPELGRVLTYAVPSALTYSAGRVKFQLVARNPEDYSTVFKSVKNDMSAFFVEPSVGVLAAPYEFEDFFAHAAKTMGEITERAAVLDSAESQALDAAREALGAKAEILSDRESGAFIGERGPANALAIGGVQTGQTAEVTIEGESPEQVLNFVLPKGDKGEKGDRGQRGSVWHKGTVLSIRADTSCPADEIGQVQAGDNFLNTANGNVYTCTEVTEDGSEWAYEGCIMGPAGETTLSAATAVQGFSGRGIMFNDQGALTEIPLDDALSEEGLGAVTGSAVKRALNEKSDKPLVAYDVTVPATSAANQTGFLPDTSKDGGPTYPGFSYRAAVAVEGAAADMVPWVNFALAEGISGKFAPVAESFDGGIYLYSKTGVNQQFVIPSVILFKVV